MRSTRGFTLIELMIVVAIIGIIASIAIPAYQDYIVRAQASEGLEALTSLKSPMAQYYSENGVWPASATVVAGNAFTSKYVQEVRLATGGGSSDPLAIMEARFHGTGIAADLQNKRLYLETADGGRRWSCIGGSGANDLPIRFLPAACR